MSEESYDHSDEYASQTAEQLMYLSQQPFTTRNAHSYKGLDLDLDLESTNVGHNLQPNEWGSQRTQVCV